ncbi:MAG: efflux RND transporter periplasmic adaptor subunit [Gemmatimonadetes bacterium]|nr:efflux RND transporter periplasmic adaptor subunit [Gemmatimonadota bacterium]
MKTQTMLMLALFGTGCSGRGGGEPPGTGDTTAASEPERQAMSGMDTQAEMEGMAGMQMNTGGPIRITTRQASLAGVTFAVASEAPLDQTVRAVAMVVPNERALGIVNVRVSGWVEKLYVNETGMHVDAGAPLFELYAPDLVTAQEELLLAKRLVSTAGGDSLVMAARRRLALWNISEQTIAEIEETGAVRRRLTIRSPYRGHVLEKNVIEGQMVRAGDRLFLIADLSTVWIEPSIFEQDIALVREGQRAAITLDALPGRDFAGRVTFIYPTLDMTTRTLRVRIEIPNPRGIIKPMMYGTVRIRTAGLRGVTVPLTAVLPTGERDVAFVLHGGAVVPTDVTVGARGDTTILVIEGLAVGDTVVASATFLFDSESSLAAAMAGIMLDMGMGLDMGGMNMGGTQMDMPDSADGGMSSDSMPGMTADTGRGR